MRPQLASTAKRSRGPILCRCGDPTPPLTGRLFPCRRFNGRAKGLDDVDQPALGYRIGVGEDELHAFMDVETSGSGFDPQGRQDGRGYRVSCWGSSAA